MSYFDPEEGNAYGKCSTCGKSMPTKEDAREHMSTTFEESAKEGGRSGHSVSITNPDRQRRIEREVSALVADAIQDALEKLDEDVIDRREATEDEVTEALKRYSDFAEEWDKNWKGQR